MFERKLDGVLSRAEILVTAAFDEVFKEYIQICYRATLLIQLHVAEPARIADDFDILSWERVFHDLGVELPQIKQSDQPWNSVGLFRGCFFKQMIQGHLLGFL